jgi:methyl-accepting chemotaxis protein
MLSNLPIARRLPIVVAALSAFAALATGSAAFLKASSDHKAETRSALVEAALAKKATLSSYLTSIENDLKAVSTNPHTLEALNRFDAAYTGFGATATADLQRIYIEQNPNPLGQKEKLDAANDGSAYSAAHRDLHPWFRSFLRTNGYYDIFLFNTKGDLVYTVFKENDFATNLQTGAWRDTGLGRVFRKALSGETAFDDFEPYAPSADAPASFIARPITDASGQTVGVLAFQMPIGNINASMDPTGVNGQTGEALLFGEDGKVRNQSRFAAEDPILTYSVPERLAGAARGAEKGFTNAMSRKGEDTMAAFAHLTFQGVDWTVSSDIAVSEANAPLMGLARDVGLASLIVALLAGGIGFAFSRTITRPLSRLNDTMKAMSSGDLNTVVPERDRRDELGAMANTVEGFREAGLMQRELEAKARDDAANQIARAKLIEQVTAEFDAKSQDVLRAVSAAAAELEATARAMTENADRTSQMAANVAAGAEESGANAQTAAMSAENLVSAIGEIERSAQTSGRVTEEAVVRARTATADVRSLSDTARRIGEVVDLIKGIADQTNLLALNATIEAARAGDAGRGFAIVAAEVKSLANQTASATEDIAGQIGAIQTAIRTVVGAIEGIDATIGLVSKEAGMISQSVTTQAAVTNEIARNVREVSSAARSVAGDIAQVTMTAGETGAAAGQVLSASRELSQQSESLKTQVALFLQRMQAA